MNDNGDLGVEGVGRGCGGGWEEGDWRLAEEGFHGWYLHVRCCRLLYIKGTAAGRGAVSKDQRRVSLLHQSAAPHPIVLDLDLGMDHGRLCCSIASLSKMATEGQGFPLLAELDKLPGGSSSYL